MSTANHFSDPDINAEDSSPFTEIVTEANGSADEELVSKAQAGDKDALEKLVRRHQPWIFNIAIRMIWRRDLAEDATQEILIKAVTKLSTFRRLSRFRTWLYRIAVNHLLGMRKSQMEENMTFTGLGRLLDELPNLDLPDPNSIPVELPLLENATLSRAVRELSPKGIDAVLDLVGNSTILDSLAMARRDGRVCLAGFLGALAPIAAFNPLLQMPSGVHFSFFGSFMFGLPGFPLSDVPLQAIVDRVAARSYQAKPVAVFAFEEIQAAHQLMESNQANGKIVVRL